MQKDIHFNMTFALAIRAGFDENSARTIAWADQFTDDLTKPGVHSTQTQCALTGNYKDPQIQHTVLCAFHFMPGDEPQVHPWMVTPASNRAKRIIHEHIVTKDIIAFGIALHTYQDTFSHQGWTGWEEKFNSCFSWDNLTSGLIPNVGHADMRTTPDIVSAVWTDPRTDKRIVNAQRFRIAAAETYDLLRMFSDNGFSKGVVPSTEKIITELKDFWKIRNYDQRKKWLMNWAVSDVRYSKIRENYWLTYRAEFVRAARRQLAKFAEMTADL